MATSIESRGIEFDEDRPQCTNSYGIHDVAENSEIDPQVRETVRIGRVPLSDLRSRRVARLARRQRERHRLHAASSKTRLDKPFERTIVAKLVPDGNSRLMGLVFKKQFHTRSSLVTRGRQPVRAEATKKEQQASDTDQEDTGDEGAHTRHCSALQNNQAQVRKRVCEVCFGRPARGSVCAGRHQRERLEAVPAEPRGFEWSRLELLRPCLGEGRNPDSAPCLRFAAPVRSRQKVVRGALSKRHIRPGKRGSSDVHLPCGYYGFCWQRSHRKPLVRLSD